MLYNDDSLNNVAQVMVDDMTFDELVDFVFNTLKKDMSEDVVLFHTNVYNTLGIQRGTEGSTTLLVKVSPSDVRWISQQYR